MADESISYSDSKDFPFDQLLHLYQSNRWSSAQVPEKLRLALGNSDSVISAWVGPRLVGLGNAITDGHLVVYYPHLLVLPEYQRQGIGRAILVRLQTRYEGFHQQMLVADGAAVAFYERCGFRRAGKTEPMWIYNGEDH